MSDKRLVVFVSGMGTTLEALCEASETGKLKASITAVISNHCGVKAGEVAKKHNLLYAMIPSKNTNCENWSNTLYAFAEGLGKPDLIILAGFSQKLFVPPEWTGKILNIHPSLLPAYGGKGMFGLNVHKAVLAAKEKYTGCSVHVVDNDYDNGPILAQIKVPVLDGDTPERLQDRVQMAERLLYPQVINNYE